MSRIRASGIRDAEQRMIQILRAAKINGWRRSGRLFGKPDFVFSTQRVAVFVDGCFWHRHAGCKFSYTPKIRLDFWLRKFSQNVARDRLVTRTLRKAGWRVLRIWECDLAAANALLLNDAIVIPNSFPKTCALLEERGFRVRTVDVSELQKAEAGVTCCSLIFEMQNSNVEERNSKQ